MRSWFLCAIVCLGLFSSFARAESEAGVYDGPAQWQEFDRFMQLRERQDRVTGLSYLVSGAVATVGGMAGYYSSEDAFSRGMYAVSQTIGIAAVGYGASVYWLGNDYGSFHRAVSRSSLTPAQRNELLRGFLFEEELRRDRARRIRAGTHMLLAAVNLYNASKEPDRDVKNLFNFLAGVNLVIGLSYSF